MRILKLTLVKMTGADVKALQSKLVELKYLDAKTANGKTNIDGIFGKATSDAVKLWQAKTGKIQDGIVTEKYAIELGLYTPPTPPKEPKSKHYTLKDFNICQEDNWKTKAAKPYWENCPVKYYPTVQKVFDKLEKLYDAVNREFAQPNEEIRIYIYCGYRGKAYNKAMGGAKHSEHMDAEAVDVYAVTYDKTTGAVTGKRELNNYQLAQVCYSLFPHGGIGLGSNLIVHLDFTDRRYWYDYNSWEAWAKSQTHSKRKK